MAEKIKGFWHQNGLGHFFLMYGFFGKAFPLYMIGAAAAASSNLLSNIFAGQLYAVITSGYQTIDQFAAGFFRVFLLLAAVVAITGAGTVLFLYSTARADYKLRKTLTESCLYMPMSEWTKRHSTDWLCVTGHDAQDASAIYKEHGQRLLGCVISVAGGLLIMVFKSPAMAFFAVGVGFFYIGIGISRAKTRKKQESLLRGASVEFTQLISDLISGSKAARFYPIRNFIIQRQEDKCAEVYGYSQSIARIKAVDGGFGSLGYTISYSGALIFGLILVNSGAVSLPHMLALWPVSMGVSFGIIDFGFFVADFQTAAAAADRVMQVLGIQREKGGEKEKPVGDILTSCRTAVSFQNVSFSYDKAPVLKNISLDIKPGEKVAFVGGSGSGKSSMMKLLLHFYQPDQGTIEILGSDAEDYSLKGLRSLYAYVPQQPGLYSGSVRENLLFGCPNAKEEDLLEALKQAGASDLLLSLPQGLDTEVGEGGGHLSGGQKQRLAVARAFLREAPILIFDEATAALDGETESMITDALANTRPEQTLLLVTHRLSTALLADRIVVLDHGRIVEMGTHEQLLKKEGYYARLWDVR